MYGGMKHGMVVGMESAQGRSGRVRRDVRLVLAASYGVECCVGAHNLRRDLVRGLNRSVVTAEVGCTDGETSGADW